MNSKVYAILSLISYMLFDIMTIIQLKTNCFIEKVFIIIELILLILFFIFGIVAITKSK